MRALCWLVVALCLWPWGGAPRATTPTGTRLLGPTSHLLSSALWVRFDALVREGRYEAAYDTAERALELDPRSPQGWMYYASHLARTRASAVTERDPAARRRWTRAALDLLARGEAEVHRSPLGAPRVPREHVPGGLSRVDARAPRPAVAQVEEVDQVARRDHRRRPVRGAPAERRRRVERDGLHPDRGLLRRGVEAEQAAVRGGGGVGVEGHGAIILPVLEA